MDLTDAQLDALKELVNIGVGQAAGMLNEMIAFRIRLQVPVIKLLSPQDLQQELKQRVLQEQLSTVQLDFSGTFSGSTQLLFPTESAATLVAVLTGEEPGSPDLDALKIGTLTELGNIVINGVMGSISNILTEPLHYQVPIYVEEDIEHLIPAADKSPTAKALLAEAHFDIEELQVQGDIVLNFLGVESFEALLSAIEAVE